MLSDPDQVKKLVVRWTWTPPSPLPSGEGFEASPIVVNDTVFIGSRYGTFYAIDASSGKTKWHYPPHGSLAKFLASFSTGIQSSASYLPVGPHGAVVFGAPDSSLKGYGYGSSRLIALDTQSGKPIWKAGGSDKIATINDDTNCPTAKNVLHEKIGHSSPLVADSYIYVGVSDANDNPVQKGKVVAVDFGGHIRSNFSFVAAGTSGDEARGGGVWNAPAADLGGGIYFTTGNSNDYCMPPWENDPPEPIPNHGASMIRVTMPGAPSKPGGEATPKGGTIAWAFAAVPFKLDQDTDWAAGAAIDYASCGELVPSVVKDGWAYALRADTGKLAWQFPNTGYPFKKEPPLHTGQDYRSPGALWNDVLVITTGGEGIINDQTEGLQELHALNVCATTEADRVRWIWHVPADDWAPHATTPPLGAATVSGGIFYVGTNNGHLIALADPITGVAAAGEICSDPDYPLVSFFSFVCAAMGFVPVHVPAVLRDIHVSMGSLTGMREEPALANGRVFIADDGHVYMLSTPTPSP